MPSLDFVTKGSSKLPGPLAQLCLGRDGTYFVVAAGKAFHAGGGVWQGRRAGNSSFIGIEAEDTGINKPGDPKHDFPWPAVQMDAYRRGVAAILKHIGQDAIMCCGHKEYRLPLGFKNDPTFDMNQFRNDVAAIMSGTAPIPAPIPKVDSKGRPTLRRGSEDNLVKEVQEKIGFVSDKIDGVFGPLTEAAVRRFQRSQGLVPDGIVGPTTWAALDGVAAPGIGPLRHETPVPRASGACWRSAPEPRSQSNRHFPVRSSSGNACPFANMHCLTGASRMSGARSR